MATVGALFVALSEAVGKKLTGSCCKLYPYYVDWFLWYLASIIFAKSIHAAVLTIRVIGNSHLVRL